MQELGSGIIRSSNFLFQGKWALSENSHKKNYLFFLCLTRTNITRAKQNGSIPGCALQRSCQVPVRGRHPAIGVWAARESGGAKCNSQSSSDRTQEHLPSGPPPLSALDLQDAILTCFPSSSGTTPCSLLS